MIRAYLDANATTRPLPLVVEAVRRSMEEEYLNASSAAAAALLAGRDPVARARRSLARLLHAEADEFSLTSGASEANSWAAAAVPAGGHVVASAIEHPSLRRALEGAVSRGVDVTWVAPGADGVVPAEAMLDVVRPETRLVTLMLANNETGVLQPVAELADAVRSRAPWALVHTDATQVVGRLPVSLAAEFAGVDLLSLSAHKFHGPKGAGALFCRDRRRPPALIHGEQEDGGRGGTYNSPSLAGLAVAAEAMAGRMAEWAALADLRDRMERDILARLPGARVNGAGAPRLPNTSSVTIRGIDAAEVVDRLAIAGVCVATGSACSAGAAAPSHVLLAMGLPHDEAGATLRLSLSLGTEWEEVGAAIEELVSVVGLVA